MSGHKSGRKQIREKRRAETSLGEFAEYVEKQQEMLYPSNQPGSTLTATSAVPATGSDDHHAELDELFDSLDLIDLTPRVALKELFLGNGDDDPDGADEALDRLRDAVIDRIVEGNGEALFDIGFEYNGDSMGLTRQEWDVAHARLVEAARRAGADCDLLLTRGVGGDVEVAVAGVGDGTPIAKTKAGVPVVAAMAAAAAARAAAAAAKKTNGKEECSGKVLVRRVPASVGEVIETRIAVVGNVDAGKSSMLGVLVKGDLDDGRGKARVNLFRHKHEIETGRTSSVGMEIMGFDTRGQVIRSETAGRKLTWEEIGKRSAKVITFTDLAGHERYLRTTVFGLLSSSPNYCLLMVAANNGLVGMSKEHLGIALALNVPVMVVITKIDICPPQILEQTVAQITKILKSPGARKVPIFIRSRDDCITTATQIVSKRICPIFQVSNVTGQNLDLVRLFLNILPHHGRYDADAPFEFHVNDTFSVPFTGTVVSGIVKSGVVHEGDLVLVGPDPNGRFIHTSIRTIERKRLRVPGASAGQSASFALKKVKRKDVRKGMVVLAQADQPEGRPEPLVDQEFVAEVLILSHATTIKPNYQAMLHAGPITQTCSIVAIDRELIRTGDRATVAFRFFQRPEYISPGDRILFREGRTKGLGIVKAIGYDRTKPLGGGGGGGDAVAYADGGRKAGETSAHVRVGA